MCAKKNSNQPAHPRSLIRVFFVVHMKKSLAIQNAQSENSDQTDCAKAQADLNLRREHMYEGTFSDVAAQYAVYISVSAEGPTVCPGTLPGAVLSPSCIRDPSRQSCDVTCRNGYRKLPYRYGGVYCEKGKWANYNTNSVNGFREICLPKG